MWVQNMVAPWVLTSGAGAWGWGSDGLFVGREREEEEEGGESGLEQVSGKVHNACNLRD